MLANDDGKRNGPRSVGYQGATHVDLMGAANAFRYRPPRLEAKGLASVLTCELVHDGRTIGPMQVLDVSPTGLGVAFSEALLLPSGTLIEQVRLIQRDVVVATESAVVVNVMKGSPMRLGLRLTSGLFDLGVLQLRDAASIESLVGSLKIQALERELLPASWRAAVADLAQLLKRTRDFFEQLEHSLPERQPDEHEQSLFSELFETWGAEYHGMLRALHAQTRALDEEAQRHGLDYAGHLLLPLIYEGPIHRRAYDKPQGYAGDFELMRLFFARTLEGHSLYARFLHFIGQRYPMALTVIARERVMRSAVRERVATGRPTRVLSLACGPALELQHLLDELPSVAHPVELMLLDQDEDALAHAHRGLHRLLARRNEALCGIQLHALHFSVIQLLRPKDAAEAAVSREVLDGMDLVYSAGLFDYLPRAVAKRLIRRLMGMLRPGGTLMLGNLREDPASAWMMEHAVAWHLVYREPDEMIELAAGLDDVRSAQVIFDETQRCMFLEIVKASDDGGAAEASARE